VKICKFLTLKIETRPLVGLFLHLVWPENEEDILLKSFPFNIVVFGSPIRTCV